MSRRFLVALLVFCLFGCDAGSENVRPDYSKGRDLNWIVFKSMGKDRSEIYVIDENGNNLVSLTKNKQEAYDDTPRWSPDGRKVVFVSRQRISPDNYVSDIYVVDAEGRNRKRLTDNIDYERNPVWSNDGTRILFAASRLIPPSKSSICLMGSNGEDKKEIADRFASGVCGSTPCWSPDNTKIAFHSDMKNGGGIFIIDMNGQNEKHIQGSKSFSGPFSWSPDGEKIAIVLNFKEGSEVCVVDKNGNNLKRLTDNKATDTTPSWSPDSKQICFASYRDGNYEIYKMNADGSNQIRLTHNKTEDVCPSWSPDGRKIVYVSTIDGQEDIYIINTDGTNQIRLTKDGGTQPSWRPTPLK